MQRFIPLLHRIFFTIVILFLFSCQQIKEKYLGISEGVITYEVKFPNIKSTSLAASMMPKKVRAYFKNSKLRVEMEIAYGLIKTVSISDSKKAKETVLMEIFGKKYVFINDAELIARENKVPYRLEKLNEKKEIAGMECTRVLVVNPASKKSFSIYYTNEIRTKNINWHTPYHDIDGMLLAYSISRNNIDMELVAENIEKQVVNDSLFKIPEGYELISKERFEEMLNELMVSAGMSSQ